MLVLAGPDTTTICQGDLQNFMLVTNLVSISIKNQCKSHHSIQVSVP